MADTNFTEEEQNSLRIVYLLKRFGTRIVQEVLLHYACKEWKTNSFEQVLKDSNIQAKLKNSVGKGVFKFQWRTLYYADFPNIHPTDVGDILDFDITLVFSLLKILSSSKSKWIDLQVLPSTYPTTVEICVSVIKFYRNSINHEAVPKIDAAKFENSFNMIKSCILSVLQELSHLSSMCPKWSCSEVAIEAVRKETLDPELKKELNDTRLKWITENRMTQQILEEMAPKLDEIFDKVKENNMILKRYSSVISLSKQSENDIKGDHNNHLSSSDSEMYTDEKTRSLPFETYSRRHGNVGAFGYGDNLDSSLGKIHGSLIQKVKARSKLLMELVKEQEKQILEDIVCNATVNQQHMRLVQFQCASLQTTSQHVKGLFGQVSSRSEYPMKFEKATEFACSKPNGVAVGPGRQFVVCWKEAIYVYPGPNKSAVTINRKVKAIAIHGNTILGLDAVNGTLCAYTFEGVGCGEWNLPKSCHGNIAVDHIGDVFISTTNYEVLQKPTTSRKFMHYLNCIDFPNNVCAAPLGLLVCEYKHSQNSGIIGSTLVRLYQSDNKLIWELCLFRDIPLYMFFSQQICCFQNGVVLVSDNFNHNIYQLSASGAYIACVLTHDKDGITKPNSLAINTGDEKQLLVGTDENIIVFNVC